MTRAPSSRSTSSTRRPRPSCPTRRAWRTWPASSGCWTCRGSVANSTFIATAGGRRHGRRLVGRRVRLRDAARPRGAHPVRGPGRDDPDPADRRDRARSSSCSAASAGLEPTCRSIVPACSATRSAIFLFRQWFRNLPPHLFESAELEGANPFQAFRHIAPARWRARSSPRSRSSRSSGRGTTSSARWSTSASPETFTVSLGMATFQGVHVNDVHLFGGDGLHRAHATDHRVRRSPSGSSSAASRPAAGGPDDAVPALRDRAADPRSDARAPATA